MIRAVLIRDPTRPRDEIARDFAVTPSYVTRIAKGLGLPVGTQGSRSYARTNPNWRIHGSAMKRHVP